MNNSELLDRYAEKNNPEIQKAINELKLLLNYAEAFGCAQGRLLFYPSLARGIVICIAFCVYAWNMQFFGRN